MFSYLNTNNLTVQNIQIICFFIIAIIFILGICYFFYIRKKDKTKEYSLSDFIFFTEIIDGHDFITVTYNSIEHRKKKFLYSIKPGTKIGDVIILYNIVDDIEIGEKFLGVKIRKILFKYETIYEHEQRITKVINNTQNIQKNEGIASINGYQDSHNKFNLYIEEWNQEILESKVLESENKLLLIEVLNTLKQEKKVDKSKAQKCLHILSGMNVMFSFSKHMIELLTSFL